MDSANSGKECYDPISRLFHFRFQLNQSTILLCSIFYMLFSKIQILMVDNFHQENLIVIYFLGLPFFKNIALWLVDYILNVNFIVIIVSEQGFLPSKVFTLQGFYPTIVAFVLNIVVQLSEVSEIVFSVVSHFSNFVLKLQLWRYVSLFIIQSDFSLECIRCFHMYFYCFLVFQENFPWSLRVLNPINERCTSKDSDYP